MYEKHARGKLNFTSILVKISSSGRVRRRTNSKCELADRCDVCGKKFVLSSMLVLHKLEKHSVKERLGKLSSFVDSTVYEDLLYSSDSDCEYSIVTTIRRLPKLKIKGTASEATPSSRNLVIEPAIDESKVEYHVTNGSQYCSDEYEQEHLQISHQADDEDNTESEGQPLDRCADFLYEHEPSPVQMEHENDEQNFEDEEYLDMADLDSPEKSILAPSTSKTKTSFRCDHCAREFSGRAALKYHVNIVHKGQINCLCNICGKSFSRQLGLELHMRRHNDDVRFICDICQKAFLTRQMLKEHFVVHTGAKPFKCKYPDCGKTFGFSAGRRNHYRYVHQPKQFACEYCDKTFVFQRFLM